MNRFRLEKLTVNIMTGMLFFGCGTRTPTPSEKELLSLESKFSCVDRKLKSRDEAVPGSEKARQITKTCGLSDDEYRQHFESRPSLEKNSEKKESPPNPQAATVNPERRTPKSTLPVRIMADLKKLRQPIDSEITRLRNLSPSKYLFETKAFAEQESQLTQDSDQIQFANEMIERGPEYFGVYKLSYAFAKTDRGMNSEADRSEFAKSIASQAAPISVYLTYTQAYRHGNQVSCLQSDARKSDGARFFAFGEAPEATFSAFYDAYGFAVMTRKMMWDCDSYGAAIQISRRPLADQFFEFYRNAYHKFLSADFSKDEATIHEEAMVEAEHLVQEILRH